MWRDQATFVISEALGRADLDVQRTALALVDRLAPTVSAACRRHVAVRRGVMEPSCVDGGRVNASVVPGFDELRFDELRFDDDPIGPPLDDDAFVQVLAELMDRDVCPIVLDQAIEAASSGLRISAEASAVDGVAAGRPC